MMTSEGSCFSNIFALFNRYRGLNHKKIKPKVADRCINDSFSIRNLRSDLFAMLRDAKLKMAHTRRADADSRPAAASSLSRRKMRILRRRKGRPAFSKRKGGKTTMLYLLPADAGKKAPPCFQSQSLKWILLYQQLLLTQPIISTSGTRPQRSRS